MEELRLTDKIKDNTKRLIDISLKVAGIRGLLFRSDEKMNDGKAKEPTDVGSEVDYQRYLIAEIERDLSEIERNL